MLFAVVLCWWWSIPVDHRLQAPAFDLWWTIMPVEAAGRAPGARGYIAAKAAWYYNGPAPVHGDYLARKVDSWGGCDADASHLMPCVCA